MDLISFVFVSLGLLAFVAGMLVNYLPQLVPEQIQRIVKHGRANDKQVKATSVRSPNIFKTVFERLIEITQVPKRLHI
jgi:hypothetical protein